MGDYKSYKLMKDAPTHFEVMHPKGEKLIIAKADLDPLTSQKISNLSKAKNFDEGGEAVSEKNPFQEEVSAPPVPFKVPDPDIIATPQNYAPIAEENQPAPQRQAVDSLAIAPPDQDPMVRNKVDEDTRLKNKEELIKNFAKQESDSFSQEGHAYKNYLDKLSNMETPQDIADRYKSIDDSAMSSYMNKSVNPNRYWSDMSVPSRILSAIGIALGGAASHWTGGKNLALDNINSAIERDIDAQKNDQSKSLSLWKMNRENLKDDVQTNLATQNQLLGVAQAQVHLAASKLQNPQAQFKASELIDQIEQQRNQNRLRLGLLQQGTQSPGTFGGLSQADPADLIGQLVPDKDRKEVADEIKKRQDMAKNKAAIMEAFDKAEQQNTLVGRAGRAGFTPPAIKEFKALTDAQFKDKEGRYNEKEAEHVYDLLPGMLSSKNTAAQNRKGMEGWLDSKMASPLSKSYGIDLDKFASTSADPRARFSPQQVMLYKESVERLKQNPQDPYGLAALQKLGIK